MNIKLEEIEVLKIAQIPIERIPSNLLKALEDYVVFEDTDKKIQEKLYSVGSLEEIAEDDYPDEIVRKYARELYKTLITFDYMMFAKC